MDSRPQPLNFDPPRFCCFPIRPLLIFTSAFGICSGIAGILSTGKYGAARASPIIPILLDLLTLVGAYYNDERALKWSRRVVIFSIWFAILNVAIWPVLLSSMFVLSVPHGNDNVSLAMELIDAGHHHSNASIFVVALVTGYLIELIFAFWIGKFYIQYILINRMWEHVKNTTVSVITVNNPNYAGYGPNQNQYIVH